MPKIDRFRNGKDNCLMDFYENCPFASIGGLDRRHSMEAPDYVEPNNRVLYLMGYEIMARGLFGEDWKTCTFEWKKALTITRDEDESA